MKLTLFLIFWASFFQVFLLGLNSQFVRDQRVAIAFACSWGISISAYTYTHIVAQSTNPLATFFAAAWGGSFGIVASIYFYRRLQSRAHALRVAAERAA